MKIVRSSQLSYLPASHEDPAKPGSLKKILFTAGDFPVSAKMQMMNWACIAPAKEFRAHYHEDMDEVFLIVTGKASIHIGDEEAVLEPGDAVHIPARAVHVMRNIGTSDLEYVVVGVSSGTQGKTVLV